MQPSDPTTEQAEETEPLPPSPAPATAGRGGQLAGALPRFPRSRPPTPTLPPPAEPAGPTTPPPQRLASPAGVAPATSSPASTDRPTPDRPPPSAEEIRDFRDAVRQAADMVFVLAGEGVGRVVARRRDEDPAGSVQRWLPTDEERRRVAAPVQRLARRHLTAGPEMADTIDICLLTAALGAYGTRAMFDHPPLEALDDDQPDPS